MIGRVARTVRDWWWVWHRRRLVARYLRGDRNPLHSGYSHAKAEFVAGALADEGLASCFRVRSSLPDGYGLDFDERVIEYPWIFSRISEPFASLLDAGSVLNHDGLLSRLRGKNVHVLTLYPEGYHERGVSYVYDDLRRLPYRDRLFDVVVCASTLEHVGLDTSLYDHDGRMPGKAEGGVDDAVRELRRVLRPGGTCLVTAPFGRAENLGWLRPFDAACVGRIAAASSVPAPSWMPRPMVLWWKRSFGGHSEDD